MGRGKLEIKRIECAQKRQATFCKRRFGLLKKAKELAILCEAEIAVIIFSITGKLIEFSSSCMKRILSRYNRRLGSTSTHAAEMEDATQMVETLRDEIAKLEAKQSQLLGKNLTGLGFKELESLEQQLNEALISVRESKEELLMKNLELSRVKEQRAMSENEILRKQVEELLSQSEQRNNAFLNTSAGSHNLANLATIALRLAADDNMEESEK